MDTYVVNKKRNDVALVTATEARAEFYDWEPVLDVVASQAARIAELEARVKELDAGLLRIAEMGEHGSMNYTMAEVSRALLETK